MAVDCGTAYALAQFVKLVAEVPHIRGVVFVSGNDLVDRINDDSFVSLVLYCVNQLGNKIVKRLGLSPERKHLNITGMPIVFGKSELFIDGNKPVLAGCLVNLEVDIEHLALLTFKSHP